MFLGHKTEKIAFYANLCPSFVLLDYIPAADVLIEFKYGWHIDYANRLIKGTLTIH